MMLVAVDPGITGSIALYDGISTRIFDIPSIKEKSGKTTRSRIDGVALVKIMKDICEFHKPEIHIEQVHAMPQNGSIANFSQGRTLGTLEGMFSAMGAEVFLISPTKWKKAMKVDSDKEKSRLLAISLFPELADSLKRKKDHNRAESLLILHYLTENYYK